MRVLVTGATGFLGRAVTGALAARGHDAVAFARSASRAALAATAIDGDIRDRAALARAADGCDAICHLAALVSIWRRRPADFDEVNVGGLENALEVAGRTGARLLYTSSFLALPPDGRAEPLRANDYQRTKVIADGVAERSVARGCPVVRVYPGVIYGPGPMTEGNLIGRLVSDHLAGRLPGLVGADRTWSCAFVDDVAAGHVAALERGRVGVRYALGGDNRSPSDVFAVVERLCGRRAPRRIPYAAADLVARFEETRARLFGGTPAVTRGAVEIFRHDWPLDSGTAVADLGYHVTPLEAGLARTLESLGVHGEARA